VSLYLHGRRVDGDFCLAVEEEMGGQNVGSEAAGRAGHPLCQSAYFR